MNKKIFESPNGGKTVFSRDFLSTEKKLESGPPFPFQVDIRQLKWQDILEKAKNDPGLDDLVRQTEVYYDLKY